MAPRIRNLDPIEFKQAEEFFGNFPMEIEVKAMKYRGVFLIQESIPI